jgi:hypothetical protein
MGPAFYDENGLNAAGQELAAAVEGALFAREYSEKNLELGDKNNTANDPLVRTLLAATPERGARSRAPVGTDQWFYEMGATFGNLARGGEIGR